MGQLKFSITFRGGKADKHWVSVDTLARVFQAISSDIANVYRVVANEDLDVTFDEIKHDSKLYLSAEPKAGSQILHFVSEPSESNWIEVAGKKWGQGLRIVASGAFDGDTLPKGITTSVLNHAKLYSSPSNDDYEEMQVTIPQADEPDIELVFNDKFAVAVEKQLIELATQPTEIQGYEIEGILHALDDQDYDNPSAKVLLRIDTNEGDWICSISRNLLPMDNINEIWRKRVLVIGRALFRPRKRTLMVQTLEILPDKPDLITAMNRFIEINSKTWEGQNPTEYLNNIREKNK
jgi:hypothetical protein